MELSSQIWPALNRMTSSFASTSSSYGGFITRVLSFTGSFNDRTSLLQEHDADAEAELGRPTQTAEEDAAGAAAPPPPPESSTEAAAPAAAAASSSVTAVAGSHPFDIEAGTTTTPLVPAAAAAAASEIPAAGQEEPGSDQDAAAESRRVGKSVLPVCLFAASTSLVLFTNLPATSNKQQQPAAAGQGQHAGLLYGADMAFISLGFFSSLGLSTFSIVARPGDGEAAAAVARRVHKWGMVVAVASVVVAFSLRVCMTLVA